LGVERSTEAVEGDLGVEFGASKGVGLAPGVELGEESGCGDEYVLPSEARARQRGEGRGRVRRRQEVGEWGIWAKIVWRR
jgi:hypothetical protein